MIQRGEKLGFPSEPCNAVRIISELFRQDLDGDLSSELLVLRLIHLTHATLSYRDEIL